MTPEEFQAVVPTISGWIAMTLRENAHRAASVASAGFKRLPLYYSDDLLARAKFVPVDEVPVPPLSKWGLTQFTDFENMVPDGITYLDTYFVRKGSALSERLHFHELIHVVQWSFLGPERFLAVYADGLEKSGYRRSPLEVMAYDLEEVFVRNAQPFDAETLVKGQLGKL